MNRLWMAFGVQIAHHDEYGEASTGEWHEAYEIHHIVRELEVQGIDNVQVRDG